MNGNTDGIIENLNLKLLNWFSENRLNRISLCTMLIESNSHKITFLILLRERMFAKRV